MPRYLQFRLRSLLLLMVFVGILLGVGKWSYDAYIARLPVQLPWKKFSRRELSNLKSRPVLVFFMAQWDTTGLLVLRQSLGRAEVASELKKGRFELRMADWTEGDPEVEQALADYKSQSIPLIVIHPAGRFDDPIILRDLVSKEQLLKAIEKATSPRKEE